MLRIIPRIFNAVIGKEVVDPYHTVKEVNALMLKNHLYKARAVQEAAKKKERYTIDDILAMSEEGTLNIEVKDQKALYTEAVDLLESTSNSVSGAKVTQVAAKGKTRSQ